jgi:hypothetical protein
VLLEMLDELAVSSRSRRNPRAIKRKMSGWPVRKRGPEGTGKIVLQIGILSKAHPMAKRQSRAKKAIQDVGDRTTTVDAQLSQAKKCWDARGTFPDPRLPPSVGRSNGQNHDDPSKR